ncbi:SDR family oxidoreductase [Pseudarthrobacter phenanthrenivorans]|uniref:SDR family NAD(P)-dependent oxidoreductase n=1 Tax=Pseudarthrobacter phenanthrenivorans TaxID=361575 RepID=UPI00344E963B
MAARSTFSPQQEATVDTPADRAKPYGKGQFAGKTIIVTGAAAGTGQATALHIASQGGRVIAVDINEERLDYLVAQNPGLDLVPVPGDVASTETVTAAVASAGQVDGLANIAGAVDNFAPIHAIDDELWERVFHVNVTAPMHLTRAVLPMMLARGRGSVVNLASEAGSIESAAGAAYTASKYAVLGLTKNSALAFGARGLRFNAVVPSSSLPRDSKWRSPGLLEGRGASKTATPSLAPTAVQVAECISFLLSDESCEVNGALVHTDGAWRTI